MGCFNPNIWIFPVKIRFKQFVIENDKWFNASKPVLIRVGNFGSVGISSSFKCTLKGY